MPLRTNIFSRHELQVDRGLDVGLSKRRPEVQRTSMGARRAASAPAERSDVRSGLRSDCSAVCVISASGRRSDHPADRARVGASPVPQTRPRSHK